MLVVTEALWKLSRAVTSGQADDVLACFTTHAELVAPQGSYVGRAQIAVFWQWALRTSGRTRCEHTQVRRVDELRAIQEGTVLQLRGDGAPVSLRYCLAARASCDGMIAQLSVYFDRWEIIQRIASQSSAADSGVIRRFVDSLDRHLLEP